MTSAESSGPSLLAGDTRKNMDAQCSQKYMPLFGLNSLI